MDNGADEPDRTYERVDPPIKAHIANRPSADSQSQS